MWRTLGNLSNAHKISDEIAIFDDGLFNQMNIQIVCEIHKGTSEAFVCSY